jgi:hypothetical protein
MANPRAGKLGRKDPIREYKVMIRLSREEALFVRRCADAENRTLSQWGRLAMLGWAKATASVEEKVAKVGT